MAGFLLLLCSALHAPFSDAVAADLGVHGQVFPVAEPDMLEMIMAKLRQMEAEGKITEMQEGLKSRTAAYAVRPPAVPGIGTAVQARSWLYDPAVVLNRDLQDQDGNVFQKSGRRINPLDYINLSQQMLFINGDDEKQVAWAKRTESALGGRAKIILVRGAVADHSRREGKPYYFDQGGKLTERFGIRNVPALIRQEGRYLRIEEVPQ